MPLAIELAAARVRALSLDRDPRQPARSLPAADRRLAQGGPAAAELRRIGGLVACAADRARADTVPPGVGIHGWVRPRCRAGSLQRRRVAAAPDSRPTDAARRQVARRGRKRAAAARDTACWKPFGNMRWRSSASRAKRMPFAMRTATTSRRWPRRSTRRHQRIRATSSTRPKWRSTTFVPLSRGASSAREMERASATGVFAVSVVARARTVRMRAWSGSTRSA